MLMRSHIQHKVTTYTSGLSAICKAMHWRRHTAAWCRASPTRFGSDMAHARFPLVQYSMMRRGVRNSGGCR